MASLLVLMSRAVSYFNEPVSYFNEPNTDVKVVLNDDHKWIECIVCDRYINPQYYNFERERYNDCCSLTQGN
jgi:hypothetical protein